MSQITPITPIKPKNYIYNHEPRVEPIRNVSTWFLDETIELNFGESVGRPSENILLQREYITRFLENGWTIDAVLSRNAEGEWQSVATNESYSDKATSTSASTSSHSAGTSGTGYSSSSSSSSTGESSVEHAKSGSNSINGGAAYWASYQRVRLKRRRMQPEKVMQDMVTSFTQSYNTGRSIDNARFNELLSLYAVVLDRNEQEANALLNKAIGGSSPTAFLRSLYNSTWNTLSSAANKAVEVSSDVLKDALADINRRYNALLSQKRSEMITTGLYNSTVWPSVEAGIERERAAAIVKARSESSQVGVSALTSVGSAKASAASAFLSAQNAISVALDNRRVTATELRNTVVKWMLDFVEKREEVYPELEEISSVAERLGFSVGSAGNVL